MIISRRIIIISIIILSIWQSEAAFSYDDITACPFHTSIGTDLN